MAREAAILGRPANGLAGGSRRDSWFAGDARGPNTEPTAARSYSYPWASRAHHSSNGGFGGSLALTGTRGRMGA